MAFNKGLGTYRGTDIPKDGPKMSNSDRLHSSVHKNVKTK